MSGLAGLAGLIGWTQRQRVAPALKSIVRMLPYDQQTCDKRVRPLMHVAQRHSTPVLPPQRSHLLKLSSNPSHPPQSLPISIPRLHAYLDLTTPSFSISLGVRMPASPSPPPCLRSYSTGSLPCTYQSPYPPQYFSPTPIERADSMRVGVCRSPRPAGAPLQRVQLARARHPRPAPDPCPTCAPAAQDLSPLFSMCAYPPARQQPVFP